MEQVVEVGQSGLEMQQVVVVGQAGIKMWNLMGRAAHYRALPWSGQLPLKCYYTKTLIREGTVIRKCREIWNNQ